MRFSTTLSLCAIFLSFIAKGSANIVPKLLLPYYDKLQVNYTIVAEEGCYRWESQNSEIASIQPHPKHSKGCTKSAVVTVQSRSPTRRITLILAENEETGTVLQCDVIVDSIVDIDIISRTRELYLDDPPETLQIRALDEEGNTFSSTAYMEFNWKLLTDGDQDSESLIIPAHKILNIKKFSETDYTAEPYVEQMERLMLQSDTILIAGLQTGTAYVMAQLKFSEEIMSAKIAIVVRDKIFLVPNGDVWLPLHGLLQYRVEKWRHGKPEEVEMPHHQYYLQLSEIEEGGPFVSLDKDTSVVVGLALGDVRLYLMDRNLKRDTIQDTSDIHVVEPAYIRFTIQPDDRWVLETGRFYTITLNIFDASNHRILPCSNLRVTTALDPQYFEILETTSNGTWLYVKALQKGVTELYGKLNGILRQDRTMVTYDPVIDTTKVAEIFDPITCIPPVLGFPWFPKPLILKSRLKAEGGSGNYSWSIENDSFAIVTSNGMVVTKAGPDQEEIHQPDWTTVRATDVRNPAHWGTCIVVLAPVQEMVFARSFREAEISTYLDLYLTMLVNWHGQLVPVGDCHGGGVVWKVLDPTVFSIVDMDRVTIPPIEDSIGCVGRRLKALREGYTVLVAKYHQHTPDHSAYTLEARVTIAGFPPLEVIDPTSIAVVSLDSSKLIIYKGGPMRWPLWHNGHVRSSFTRNKTTLEVSSVMNAYQGHQVIARCRSLGETEVILKVYNKPCTTNPMPVTSTAVVKVACEIVKNLELRVSSLLASCPLLTSNIVQSVAVINNTFSINLTVYDDLGRMFDNFSSIHTEWRSDTDHTTFEEDLPMFIPLEGKQQRKQIVKKVVDLSLTEGEQFITVALTRYKDGTSEDVCNKYNCNELDPVVLESVGILAVSAPVLTPSYVLLYNHLNFTQFVTVSGGSGHFRFHVEQAKNISVILERGEVNVKLGSVRSGVSELQVFDLCISEAPMALADIFVVEVGRLTLTAPTRMEHNSKAKIKIEVEDHFGNPLIIDFLQYTKLEITYSIKDIVVASAIEADSDAEELVGVANITASNVGCTMITAIARLRDGRIIQSNAVHITVIRSLELYPPMITLIRHAEFQLRTIGGPRTDFTMRFLVEDQSGPVSINVSQTGVVHALKLGTSHVTAHAVMHDGTVFHCKHPTVVKVVQLAGIRIDSPLTQYHVGGTIPLHVNGLDDDENPMSFGSAAPGLIFKWESGNPTVVNLHTVHAQAGIETSDRLSFTMLAEGVSSGHCSVSVRVTAEDEDLYQLREKEFIAEISLVVYDPLAIISTDSCVQKQWKSTSNFLITPSTSHHLHTNRDGVAKSVEYKVLSDQKCVRVSNYGEDEKEEEEPCIKVSVKGVITSGPHQCQTTIMITSMERFGVNQSLALHVLVRPVAYTIARATSKFRTRDNFPSAFAFPLSSSVRFEVDQFDDKADKFDATCHNVILHYNRVDRFELQPESGNRSFNVRLPLEGTAIMSVESYLKSSLTPSAVYYFPITVLPAIKPREQQLTVGLKFCFYTEFINLNGSFGSWGTNNPKFVVDAHSGAVLALGRGTAELRYTVDTFDGKAQVSTAPFVASLADSTLTGPVLSKFENYSLPIELSPGYPVDQSKCSGLDKSMKALSSKLFVCTVHFYNYTVEGIYTAKPEYLPKKNQYACVIFRRELADSDRKSLALVDDKLVVKLEVHSNNLGTIQQGVTTVSFLPSFYWYITSTTLVVGSHVTLCILATETVHASLKIIPCDTDVITILNNIKMQEQNKAVCYDISTSNKDVTIRTAYLRLVNHLTEQNERIDFMIDRMPGRLLNTPSQCSNLDRTMWRGGSDMMADTYLAYLTTFAVIIISTAFLLAALTAYRWVSNNSGRQSEMGSPRPPPYDPNLSMGSPRTPGSSPKVRLWSSRYYQPQQASPSTG